MSDYTNNQIIKDWLNSGEFYSDIEDVRSEILKTAKAAENERQTANAFENALYYLIRNKTGLKIDFFSEKSLDNVVHKFGSLSSRTSGHGRLDAIVNNLVIEYKHYKKLGTQEQYNTACQQVYDYLQALYDNTNTKFNAILTDGLKICYFNYSEDGIHHSSLSQLSKNDIETIIKAIVLNEKKKFVPKNIIHDFSISYDIPSASKSLALELYNILKYQPTDKTKMLYEEWLSLLHLSIEDNGKSNDIEKRRRDLSLIFQDDICDVNKEYKALWALQTTYAIIVKLIACKAVDKIDYNNNARTFYDLSSITSKELQKFFEKLEDGYSYQNSNVTNFLEGDFFSWYSDSEQWNPAIHNNICRIILLINEYTSFNFNFYYEPVDVFKDLYMGIIPKSIRHSMGEYFTPEWLADCIISEGLSSVGDPKWKAIDPCCGSGIFIISLIKHIVGKCEIKNLSIVEKDELKNEITKRVYGIDINPLSVLSARVGYYMALQPLGNLHDVEIPVYLGDSAIVPSRKNVDGIDCYEYSVTNEKLPFDVLLPARFVKETDFSKTMSELQACVKTDDPTILLEMIRSKFNNDEKKSLKIAESISRFAENLVYLHKNNWDGIWVRIATNFMLIARLDNFDFIVGNPPWVKWEHLPTVYANKIKTLCNIKHIFSNDGGQFGGTQLNICALISNVVASNWLKPNGILAFLMPDSIMSQNSYEEFRNFYINYSEKKRLYIQKIDRWLPPLRPFRCDDKPVTQDFNTYYFSSNVVDYSTGIPVRIITRNKKQKDSTLNNYTDFEKASQFLQISSGKAAQLSQKSTAFSYISDKFDYSKIIGETSYQYRTGVEFTPQELYMLVGIGSSDKDNYYRFRNKKFQLSKYTIDDAPPSGWELPTEYIYPIVTSTNLDNFCYEYRNEYCILPYNQDDIKNPIPIQTMINSQRDLFNYLVSHKDLIDQQSEKSKQMHRGKEFYALSKIGKYTFAPYIVAARDNTRFCASVIKSQKTGWGNPKNSICVKHTIVISQDKSNRNIEKEEAYYISGILNSSIVVNYMHDSFKKNGFSLNKSNIYLPLFDNSNEIHKNIANLAKKGENSKDKKEIQEQLTKFYLELCDKK